MSLSAAAKPSRGPIRFADSRRNAKRDKRWLTWEWTFRVELSYFFKSTRPGRAPFWACALMTILKGPFGHKQKVSFNWKIIVAHESGLRGLMFACGFPYHLALECLGYSYPHLSAWLHEGLFSLFSLQASALKPGASLLRVKWKWLMFRLSTSKACLLYYIEN